MIHIIDYGRGNLRSVHKAFLSLGLQAEIVNQPEKLNSASGIVLPGVGAFGDCMSQLENKGFPEIMIERIGKGVPFLGICLGLQLLFEESEESPGVRGLSLLKGKVVRFQGCYKIPQMGWNQVQFRQNAPFVEGIPEKSYFYFVHSYKVEPGDQSVMLGETDYHGHYVSAVNRANMLGFQFHPEKSQKDGLRLLKNWGESCAG
ncbi:MAG: imidazole glycerol phosphate synthase subunit HisH [Candidatus Aureabacteria bacterium]|nr:imidazole glycerol phosphate synthase subunit HisH [Candidatus Auribacterota bacterium]